MSAVERCEKEGGLPEVVGVCFPGCVFVRGCDCQCCTTVKVEQCRMARATKGQSRGGKEVGRKRNEEV